MTQPIHIVHIISALNRGGIEMWLMYLLRLKRPNVQFDFVVFYEGVMDEEAKSLGANIHYLPFRRPTILRHQKELKQIFQENKYDAVHYHFSSFSGIVMKIAAECDIPVRIDHAHNTQRSGGRYFTNTIKEFYRQYIDLPQIDRYATSILACSQEAGKFYFGKLWDREIPTNMVYCGIPLEPYDKPYDPEVRSKLIGQYGLHQDAVIVGTLGRLSYQKNHEFLINIFAELAKRDNRYALFIGGEGELRGDLEKQIETLSLQDRVVMPGLCSNVPELLCHLFNVFILPSRFEGLPVCMIEAVSSGLYSVCSDSITKEMFQYIPERVTWQSLSAHYAFWCDAIEEGIKRRLSPQEGVACVRNTSFEINQSMNTLLDYYRQVHH